jgi:hypothetical protein
VSLSVAARLDVELWCVVPPPMVGPRATGGAGMGWGIAVYCDQTMIFSSGGGLGAGYDVTSSQVCVCVVGCKGWEGGRPSARASG